METVRKRPLADADSSQSIAKKRIIADENDTPRANGTPPAEERDDGIDPAKLESFRKQAIFRRMKAHERESDRNRAQLEQLRERNRNTEEGLKALVACWSQLINTIRSLVPSESVVNGQDPNPPGAPLASSNCARISYNVTLFFPSRV
ncbi:hypothetical protein DL96DRAFT_1603720 [Flagelloscypha sp. PMI_526]|nr:hypothetical protein DL96DRAFT_1603720 [Flagelloscypha sp. PMI_526]